jgi:transcriptional regulator with XRE-family HTH domain
MSENLARNLALVCSFYPSIAEVCRRLQINRQQFNRYLSGRTHPSRSNMRRICDFFGVTEGEILQDSDVFEEMIALRPRTPPQSEVSRAMRHLERLYETSQNLDKYVGYYFRYFFSFGNAGMIIRSLAVIFREDGRYFWKNIEILRDPETSKTTGLNKYEGAAFFLADRIYVVEYETLERVSITQMTLYPTHRTRLDKLVGVQTGGPTRRGRKPGASRVALEYLGRHVDMRRALSRLGLFSPESGEIRAEIVNLIENRIEPGSFVLDIEEP